MNADAILLLGSFIREKEKATLRALSCDGVVDFASSICRHYCWFPSSSNPNLGELRSERVFLFLLTMDETGETRRTSSRRALFVKAFKSVGCPCERACRPSAGASIWREKESKLVPPVF
jgi:hypothetical protein